MLILNTIALAGKRENFVWYAYVTYALQMHFSSHLQATRKDLLMRILEFFLSFPYIE